ncbi:hypothetical protein ACFOOM_24940 [Streptomyces echinoruber]|uniref:hypothetical protein n=1 Tax=Streptomyces echinoruber TaxID=68898 RepID=UPI00361C15D8
MTERVPVRCPACRRVHAYAAPSYPCPCGHPVAPRLDRGAEPVVVVRPVWEEQWITVRCPACDRAGEWPHPELGCPCGALLRVRPARADGHTATADVPGHATAADVPGHAAAARAAAETAPATAARAAAPRPAFRSVAIRTARDAVTATVLYLRRLGHRDIRRADQRPAAGVCLAARGLLALVDPRMLPACARDVECLWLTAMTESADCAYFSLTGYTDDAHVRAGALGVALFVLALSGVPRPVNTPADALAAGADGPAPG